jgi:hypothetical protein
MPLVSFFFVSDEGETNRGSSISMSSAANRSRVRKKTR